MKEFTNYDVDYFMGLFAIEDMEYQLEQTPEMDDPTLAEMTETALNILNTKPNGFVAFIEAGLVDHGHHGNKVRKKESPYLAMYICMLIDGRPDRQSMRPSIWTWLLAKH